ncbi:Helicase SWR1 [Ceratocystis fimbriata CBS 114723]|uniref:DNA helicase n=1 Tax=Ceratocystis fimbriata CBS 114723 TaxID=1035309 RepID=A0A2C5WWD1_9PEZI|nr:Helicase SWR1 [Ceratocystis fimbriata CBS 114723]
MTGFASTEDFHALRDSTSPLSDSRPRTPTPPPGFTSPLPPNSNGHSLDSLNGDKALPVDATSTLAAAGLPAQDSVEDRPSKRRRVAVNDDTTTNLDGAFNGAVTPTRNSSARKKIESPPWKNAAAEGPTTIVENGRRKSGRISTVQLLQRNITAITSSPPSTSSPTLRRGSRTESTPSTAVKQNASSNPPPLSTGRRSARSTATATNAHQVTPAPRPARRSSIARESRAPSRASRRRSPSPTPQPTRQSSRTTRTAPRISLVSRSLANPDKPRRSSIRTLRNAPILHTEVPLVNPGQVPLRKRIGSSFEEFWDIASSRPVEEGGLFTPEDGPPYTDEMATRDAQVIIRIEEELEPGGLLSQERCSLFAPENVEEPGRQWAHYDHLVKAAQNIRRLMIAEQTRHRLTAKKLAEACRDEWLRRQPKSDQQLETEARARNIAKYRIVTRSIAGMWENVRGEVNRQRLARWEAEEQKRVKAALNEAVNISEQKLQARRTTMDEGESDAEDIITNSPSAHNLGDDIDMMTDSAESASENEDDVNRSESDATALDDDDMSDSVDESDDGLSSFDNDERKTEVDDDEILTPDQLRAKYADLPKISHKPGTEADAIVIKADDAETSDESVDMDDDLGSSDMSETGSENGSINGNVDDDDDSDSDGESDGATGLLGMLFGKQELRNFKQEETPDDTQSNAASEAPPTTLADANDRSATPVVTTSPMEIDNSEQVDLGTMVHDSTNRGSTEPACTSQNTKPTFDAPYSNTSPETRHEAKTATPLSTEPTSVPTPMEIDDPRDNTDPPTPITTSQQSNTQLATQDPSVQVVSSVEPAEDKVYQSVQELIVSPNPTSESRELSTVPTEAVPKTEIPFLLRGTLREYQHYGLDWLAGLYANNTNGILADEMGLGKTIQTISLLAHLACHHGIWGPHLVVVPTSVMLNWEMEFKKWCPGFKIMAYYGSIEERRRKRHGWNNDDLWNVCITSYQLVLQDNQVFRRRKWHYLILDEAHNIKNFKSLRWQTLLGFNTQARLLITGTPLQNNLTELWSLLFFLMPSENGVGGFADLQEFHDWFAKPESQILESGKEQLDEEGRAIISKLHKVLRPYLLRRLKADVEKQMPAKYEHVVFCRLSKRQRELYDGFLARSDTRATLAGGNYLSIINCLMQLRKVCNHPDLFVDRPIQTSLRLEKSVPSEFALTSKIVKHLCFTTNPAPSVSLSFLNLVPAEHERQSSEHALRISELCAQDELMSVREAQKERALLASTTLNPTTVESSISFLEGSARWGRFEELQHCVYLNALRCQQKPIYGKNLTDFLTLDLDKRPRIQRPRDPQKLMEWFENKSFLLESIVKDVSQRSEELETTIQKFACVTPAVVSRDMPELFLGSRCVAAFKEKDSALSTPVRWSPFIPPERPLDPWHEARIRLSIQFPDKRLLQYDCGKLQALDKLLRKLQSGGHRALIFTQMTRVLDILEQFLNIHGHKYLRLDGATKVEQRQLLTDRFNSDKRILCFILSTRSGGLGINLTGADTVIFYDQDWNPAMDKQCQDRCHRIGQTRDVHIYRLVSEHTIESNILRKASQKQMLDDVVIQDGGFTTDYFNRVKVHDALDEDDPEADLQNGIAAASAAMDRVLGGGASGNSSAVGHQFEQVEDREDVTAARVAEKEIQDDEADFSERAVRDDSQSQSLRPSEPPSESPATPMVADSASGIEVVAETDFNVHGKPMKTIDDFMLDCMGWMLEGVPLEIPKDKKKNKGRKRGKDTRRR